MTDVLVVAEHRRGELRPVSFELVSAGRVLADAASGSLGVAVVGGDVDSFTSSLDRSGVDVVYAIDDGEEFNHDVTVAAITELSREVEPTYVLAPHSANGLDYVPALAERLGLPLVTNATDLEVAGDLQVTRTQYGGKVETTVGVAADRAVLSVLEGAWPPADGTGDATIESFDPEIDPESIRTTVNGFQEVGAGDVDITDAEFVVSIGRGIEEEENLALIERLVEVTGATLAASRPVVDNEWLPQGRQVGQSGKTVTPTVYLAIGISGAVQHVAGMKGSETIVAINEDPDAPIFDVADYGIVGDLFEVVPALIEEFGGEAP